jgi:hypothetical protein
MFPECSGNVGPGIRAVETFSSQRIPGRDKFAFLDPNFCCTLKQDPHRAVLERYADMTADQRTDLRLQVGNVL